MKLLALCVVLFYLSAASAITTACESGLHFAPPQSPSIESPPETAFRLSNSCLPGFSTTSQSDLLIATSRSFQSIYELRRFPAQGLSAGTLAQTTGYRSNGDGGSAVFAWEPLRTDPDNGATTIAPSFSRVGRWVLTGSLNARQFGATGNGSTDDSAAIRAYYSYVKSNGGGRLTFPQGYIGSIFPSIAGTILLSAGAEEQLYLRPQSTALFSPLRASQIH